jgi:hypothetical protein
MYCKKCGTYIDGESELCPACKAQEDFNFDNNTTVVDNTPNYTEQEKYNDRRAGLKGSIISTIFGEVGFSLVYIAMIVVALEPVVSLFFMLASIPFTIIALIKGINCIKLFKRHCKEGRSKPIATLVLGINGVVMAGLSLVFLLLTFELFVIATSLY